MVAPPNVDSDVALEVEAVDDGVKPRPCLGSVDGLGMLGVVCDRCHLALLSIFSRRLSPSLSFDKDSCCYLI